MKVQNTVLYMSLKKFFELWNKKKQKTHREARSPEFYDGEIWWVQFGQNIATEIYGKGKDFLRPAVVFRKVYKDACLVVPLTLQEKTGNYYFSFRDRRNLNQYAILHQIRYVDAKRLNHRFGEMKEKDFSDLQENFVNFITKK